MPERAACAREQFAALLAGVPALRLTPGIPKAAEAGPDYYQTLPLCATEEDEAACRAHLEKVYRIRDKESMMEFCNREIRCQGQYLDFEAVWEGRPSFPIDQLKEGPRKFFQSAMDFSAQFYEVCSRHGFLGWDISECMGSLRAAYACKILTREEFDQMADYWMNQAKCFQNWLQYGISLICGAMYWNFRCGTEKEQLTQSHELWPSQMRNYLGNWRGPSGCFATDHITVLGKPVGWCYREEPSKGMPDSGWRFFSGEEDDHYVNDPSHTEVYHLNTICNYSPDILPLLDAPVGTAFMRGRDGKFRREGYVPGN